MRLAEFQMASTRRLWTSSELTKPGLKADVSLLAQDSSDLGNCCARPWLDIGQGIIE
jgi:hypothetical protein